MTMSLYTHLLVQLHSFTSLALFLGSALLLDPPPRPYQDKTLTQRGTTAIWAAFAVRLGPPFSKYRERIFSGG